MRDSLFEPAEDRPPTNLVATRGKERYYVYIYYDGETPIYVGKGQGRCAWRHVEGRKPNESLYAFILDQAAGGVSVEPQIVFRTDDEVEAYAHERALIAKIGRVDLQTGTLFNRCEGIQKRPSARVLQKMREVLQRIQGICFDRGKIQEWISSNEALLDDPDFAERKRQDLVDRARRRVEKIRVEASTVGITEEWKIQQLEKAGFRLEKWRERKIVRGHKTWITYWRIVGTGQPFLRVRRGFGEFGDARRQDPILVGELRRIEERRLLKERRLRERVSRLRSVGLI